MKVGFRCVKCGKVTEFETKTANHLFEDGEEAPIFTVYCVYCGVANNNLLQIEKKKKGNGKESKKDGNDGSKTD